MLIVPSISDVPDPRDPAVEDRPKFGSDEELSQRTLCLCFVVVLGWSILCLACDFPPYDHPTLFSRNCPGTALLGRLLDLTGPQHPASSTTELRDISSRGNASVLEIVNGEDPKWCARRRIIILLIVIGLFLVLVKILLYSKLVAF